jgi:hypothetical protein
MKHSPELFDTGRVAARQPFVHGSHNINGHIEWYTPRQYIDSAIRVMGGIDCDPATSERAQQVIKARTYHTLQDDGLSHVWKGRVWLNPPYAAKHVTLFVDHLLAFLDSKDVTQAILLTHNNADTLWFQKSAMRAAAVCFTRGRVRFWSENGKSNSPTHGHTFMYFGRRRRAFEKEFSQYGWIPTLGWTPPKQ